MPRQDVTPAEAVSLEGFRKTLEKRRQQHYTDMAKGVEEQRYWELVGRVKEIDWLIGESDKRVQQLRSGDHDE